MTEKEVMLLDVVYVLCRNFDANFLKKALGRVLILEKIYKCQMEMASEAMKDAVYIFGKVICMDTDKIKKTVQFVKAIS